MQLIYRGAIYDYDSVKASAQKPVPRTSPYKLIYRGSTYWVNPSAIVETAAEPVVCNLMYRGCKHQVHRN